MDMAPKKGKTKIAKVKTLKSKRLAAGQASQVKGGAVNLTSATNRGIKFF
jgi:hypothetical protein